MKELRDKRLKQISPEVPPRAKGTFDDFAFADHREDTPDESDNETEQEVYDELFKHIVQNSPINKKTQNILLKALEKGWYKKIIHAPQVNYIFRGLTAKKGFLEKALSAETIPESGIKKGAGKYTPKDGAASTSWSINIASALGFAYCYSTDEYSILIKARVSDNPNTLIDCNDGIYKIDGLETHKSEHEVITLTDVKVCTVYWWRGENFSKFKKLVLDEENKKKLRAKHTGKFKHDDH